MRSCRQQVVVNPASWQPQGCVCDLQEAYQEVGQVCPILRTIPLHFHWLQDTDPGVLYTLGIFFKGPPASIVLNRRRYPSSHAHAVFSLLVLLHECRHALVRLRAAAADPWLSEENDADAWAVALFSQLFRHRFPTAAVAFAVTAFCFNNWSLATEDCFRPPKKP